MILQDINKSPEIKVNTTCHDHLCVHNRSRRTRLQNPIDLYIRRNEWCSTHFSPCGFPKEMGSLGSEGSLTPYLLTERTLKQYCLPLTRSNTGNLGEFTSMSRLASSQLLSPARDWSKHSINKKPQTHTKIISKALSTSISRTCSLFRLLKYAGGFNLPRNML